MARPVSQGGIDYLDGGFASGSGVFPMAGDLAELAARLGCISTHNREGNIVFIETFEHGLQGWDLVTSGTGSEIIISAEAYRSSGYSCKLIAGSDGGAGAKIFRKYPYPVLGRYALELSFLLEAHTDQLLFKLVYHDGTQDQEFGVIFDVDDRDLKIRDSDGSWVTVDSDLYLDYQYAGFHTAKIVADFSTNEFVRLVVNHETYELDDYSAYPYTTTDGKNVRADIQINGDAGYNGFSYIDDIILTQNEPSR